MLQFNDADITRIRARVKKQPALLEALREQTNFFFAHGIKVPTGTQSTWIMNFVCPEDSATLIYDYASDTEYTCPVCGKKYSGMPYSGAWWRYTVEKTVDGGFLCAVVWMITGEEKYKDIAVEILERFAGNYAGYELHGGIIYNNPGMINSQTLCEALTLRSLVMAFDIVADVMPEEWRASIIERLIAPSVQVMCEQRMNQLHNHEVVIDSSLAIAGLVMERQDIIDFAVSSKYGLRYQMENGVLEDGFWFEGTVHYHYFTLWACMMFEKFAKDTPYTLRHLGIYERMYSMPLRLMKPDFHMPCLGDGNGEGMFEELAEYYEFPYALLGTKSMAQLLNKVYTVKARDGMQALLYGADEIESTEPLTLANYHDDEASGLTVLRGAEGQYLLFKHGKFGGEHDHYDKLGIHYSVGSDDVIADFGTVGYNAPHHYQYFKNTFTHNTVCINGVNQPPADGKTIAYRPGEDETLVEGWAGWLGELPDRDSLTVVQWDVEAYQGIQMNRVLLMRDEYFIEAFLVRGAQNRTVDWILHPHGAWQPREATKPEIVGDTQPQRFFHDAVSIPNQDIVESKWKQPMGMLRLWSSCNCPGKLIYAQGPDNPPDKQVTYLIHRVEQQADDILFMNVFCLERDAWKLQRVVMRQEHARQVEIEVTHDGVERKHAFTIGAEKG